MFVVLLFMLPQISQNSSKIWVYDPKSGSGKNLLYAGFRIRIRNTAF
jgi:hypothetical protein